MQRTVEILLIIGVLINLIKGAELILRPHQEKWLQDRFETLVLWLEYVRPVNWFAEREVAVYRTVFVLLITPMLAGTIVLIINPKNASWWSLTLIILISIVMALEAAINTIKSENRFERWLFKNLPLRQRLGRHIIIGTLVLTLVFLFWIIFIDEPVAVKQSHNPASFSFLITLAEGIGISVFYLFIIMGLPSLAIVLISLLFSITELLLKFIRGISWRMVEYNKGVFAAIILLVTVALGVADIYLKSQPNQ
ncbi:MAG: hypothetical protein ACRD6X_16655 [Pyrinomonadaceae bacterium]